MRCLVQGHLDTRLGAAGDRTSNLQITSQPAPPPELYPRKDNVQAAGLYRKLNPDRGRQHPEIYRISLNRLHVKQLLTKEINCHKMLQQMILLIEKGFYS